MVSPKRQIVIPIPRPQLVSPPVSATEQPRAFQFAVTWQTLLAQLQPVEISQPEPTAVVVAAPPIEIVPREAPERALQVVDPPAFEPEEDVAAWEMVVPKMIRRPS